MDFKIQYHKFLSETKLVYEYEAIIKMYERFHVYVYIMFTIYVS